MSLIYILETTHYNGSAEAVETPFNKSEVLVGRGASNDLVLADRLLSLNHARFVLREGRFFVEDLNSLSGVFINGSLTKFGELKAKDQLRLGNTNLTVVRRGDSWALLEQRKISRESEDEGKLIEQQVARLSFVRRVPSMTVLCSCCALFVLLGYFVRPFIFNNWTSWSSGKISNAHSMIAADCKACHSGGFSRVQDQQCLSCHKLTEHAPSLVQNHPEQISRCASCHMEHNGDQGIITKDSALCANCHAQVDRLVPDTKLLPVSSWASHPEFHVDILSQRVAVNDKAKAIDRTPLKLNHKLHLAPDLAGPQGPEKLECSSCHSLDSSRKQIKPIDFEDHCVRCHSLEFDSALPGKAAPHGKPQEVYNFLYAEYARLFLLKAGQLPESELQILRRKPGGNLTKQQEIEFSQKSVETKSREIENDLFNRTGCQLCHYLKAEAGGQGYGEAQYDVENPHLRVNWMPKSVFDHGAHGELGCDFCHATAKTSAKTEDLLLPGVETCKQCHVEEGDEGPEYKKVRSDCRGCHSYHDKIDLPENQRVPLATK